MLNPRTRLVEPLEVVLVFDVVVFAAVLVFVVVEVCEFVETLPLLPAFLAAIIFVTSPVAFEAVLRPWFIVFRTFVSFCVFAMSHNFLVTSATH